WGVIPWAMRWVRIWTANSRNFGGAHGPTTWFTMAMPMATRMASTPSGLISDQAGVPPAAMTMSSLSLLRRLRTWMEAMSRAMGAISAIMLGIASVVITRKRITS